MPDLESTPEMECRDNFKEAVCIDAMRIYDSCSEKHPPPYKRTPCPLICWGI